MVEAGSHVAEAAPESADLQPMGSVPQPAFRHVEAQVGVQSVTKYSATLKPLPLEATLNRKPKHGDRPLPAKSLSPGNSNETGRWGLQFRRSSVLPVRLSCHFGHGAAHIWLGSKRASVSPESSSSSERQKQSIIIKQIKSASVRNPLSISASVWACDSRKHVPTTHTLDTPT